jgi:hypothetical protein
MVVRGGIRPRLMEHRRCQDAAGPSFHHALLRALRADPFGVLLGGVAAGASAASLRSTKGSNPAAPFQNHRGDTSPSAGGCSRAVQVEKLFRWRLSTVVVEQWSGNRV